jgi:hypothetical protein
MRIAKLGDATLFGDARDTVCPDTAPAKRLSPRGDTSFVHTFYATLARNGYAYDCGQENVAWRMIG